MAEASGASGAAEAGAGLVKGLIEAKQRRKQRIMEAKDKVRESVENQGTKSASAIQDVIKNLRASLGR